MSENANETTEDESAQSGEEAKDRLKEFSSAIERVRDESDSDDCCC